MGFPCYSLLFKKVKEEGGGGACLISWPRRVGAYLGEGDF